MFKKSLRHKSFAERTEADCSGREIRLFTAADKRKYSEAIYTVNKVNLTSSANATGKLFEYLRIGTLNGHMLNVLQAENRTLEFHVHENSDELFYCIEGEFDIEFQDGLTHMCQGDLIIIPKGTLHRPVCKKLVKCLLIETEGTLNASNTGGSYEA